MPRSLRNVFRREFITDFSRVEAIPVRAAQLAGSFWPSIFSSTSSHPVYCLLQQEDVPPSNLRVLLHVRPFVGLFSVCFHRQGMYIANQVDEAAMGVSRDYTNFLQAGAACARGIGTCWFIDFMGGLLRWVEASSDVQRGVAMGAWESS